MNNRLDLAILNNRQREAVTAPPGPLLVLAGAGSGKTRVLAYRIVYLIEQGIISPDRILALTFTNKAAREMRERVHALLSGQLSVVSSQFQEPTTDNRQPTTVQALPALSTFHSLGVKILRQHGYILGLSKVFAILDTEDQLKLLKEVFALHNIDESLKPQAVLHFIHGVKNTGLAAEEAAAGLRGYVGQQFIAAYYGYQTELHKQGSVDLDDLIVLPVKLLSEFPEVRSYYQDKFRYILVDEYQDTNPIQYQFLRQLSPPAPLFVVGDDAQSIYGFRGSDIANILNFERDFPQSKVVVLDQNYRSTQSILAVADRVLQHSTEQKPKVLWTENAPGQKVWVKELSNETAEADFIVGHIIGLATGSEAGTETLVEEELVEDEDRPFSVLDYMLGQKKKVSSGRSLFNESISTARLPVSHGPLSAYAVLYRTHAQSRVLEAALLAAGIPYKIVGGVRFFDRKEIKDAVSFLRALVNVRDGIALARAFSIPPKGIGDKTAAMVKDVIYSQHIEHVSEWGIAENGLFIDILQPALHSLPNTKARAAVVAFFAMVRSWIAVPTDMPLHELVQRILNESGLLKHYIAEGEAGESRVENLKELISVAQNFSSKGWIEGLAEFLEEVALMSDLDTVADSDDAVTLMTLHGAKGLEFDVVFFAGLEEGLLPHSRSMLDPKAFAEEVRLAYVGVTRARHQLYLTYVRQRGIFGESRLAVPSRLLRELPEQSVQWKSGRPKSLPHNTMNDKGIEYEPFQD